MAFLAEQIFQWRPEVRPLTGWEWAVVGLFLLGDIPLLGPYARKALARPQQKHYGAMNLIAHFLAGAGMVVLGPLGLALQIVPQKSPASITASLASSICVAVACCSIISADFVLGMSRRTQGHKGYVMFGYNDATLHQ